MSAPAEPNPQKNPSREIGEQLKLLDVVKEGYNLSQFATLLDATDVGADELAGGYIRKHQVDERPYSLQIVAVTSDSVHIYDLVTNGAGPWKPREDQLVRHVIPARAVVSLTKTHGYRSQTRAVGELVQLEATVRLVAGSWTENSIELVVNDRAYPGDYGEEIDRLNRFLGVLEGLIELTT